MKLRNRKIIACTQCDALYTVKAFRKLETSADGRHVCKSCDFAKGFVFDADTEMLFSFYNSAEFDALMQKTIEIDLQGPNEATRFVHENLLDVLEKFSNEPATVKAFAFALDTATLTAEEFQLAIDYARQGKSLDTLYNELVEKHTL
jgi:hypothetical protein